MCNNSSILKMPGKLTNISVEHYSGEAKKLVDVKFTDDGAVITIHDIEKNIKTDELILDHAQISILCACLTVNGTPF